MSDWFVITPFEFEIKIQNSNNDKKSNFKNHILNIIYIKYRFKIRNIVRLSFKRKNKINYRIKFI